MNEHDSENIAGRLLSAGFTKAESESEADIIIVNTCVVRKTAEQRAMGHLNHIKKQKIDRGALLGCAGCLSSIGGKKLSKLIPHLDFIITPQDIDSVVEIINRARNERYVSEFQEQDFFPDNVHNVRKENFRAWISIMKGCDNYCSYCIVPFTRGRERSRPEQEIISEIKTVVADGAREIVLLGQNVNSYGPDPGHSFPSLIRKVNSMPGDFWIRFMTSQPRDFTDDLVEAIASSDRVSRHIHLPLQSGSDRILSIMNRHYTLSDYRKIIALIREKLPGISITTDIIVGFPGETEEDFQETISAINEFRFDGFFGFIYSDRPGTKACDLPEKLSEEEKKKRLRHILDLQEPITAERLGSLVGTETTAIAERWSGKIEGQVFGHDYHHKVVLFKGQEEDFGKFVRVRITEAGKWALKAEKV